MSQESVEVNIPTAEEFLEKIESTTAKNVQEEFIGRVVTITIAGLGLISALAWDETLKTIYHHFVGDAESIGAVLGYAVIVTALAVLASIYIGKLFLKRKEK